MGVRVKSGGSLVKLNVIDPGSISGGENRPENLLYGLISMDIKLIKAGGTAIVEIYLPEPLPENKQWFGYGSAEGWTEYIETAEFNSDRNRVTLTLTDNGTGDEMDSSAIANKLLKNLSGPGTPHSKESKDELISLHQCLWR